MATVPAVALIFKVPKAVVPPMMPSKSIPPLSSVSPARIVKLPVEPDLLSTVLVNLIIPSSSALSVSIVTSPLMNVFPVSVTFAFSPPFEVMISPSRVIPSAAVISTVNI